MTNNAGTSNFVTLCRQSMGKVIEDAVTIGGLYVLASAICEMDFVEGQGYVPLMNPDGSFQMKVTDEELKEMGHPITAQQLGRTFFGMAYAMSGIAKELSDEIIATRI